MDAARFSALVTSLERLGREDPEALRRRVRWLVALGYGYVFGCLLLVVGTLVALLVMVVMTRATLWAWKIIIALAALVYVMLKALWIHVPAPEGEVLRKEDAPRFWRRVEEIRRALKAPRADVVLLTRDYNAAVTQVPRFGIFGAETTYLIVGLPLMYALEPRHLDAVLAHEFGHLSGSHPKVGLRVFHVGSTWGKLQAHLGENGNWGRFMFNRFFRWYVPRLNAHAFALCRDDEFAADADAARVTSPRSAGQALAALRVRGVRYDRFWSAIRSRLEHESMPPAQSWSAIPQWIADGESLPERATWLAEELRRESLVEDTHPSLRARLSALKVLEAGRAPDAALLTELVLPLRTTSADHYLGSLATKRLEAWEKAWLGDVTTQWAAQHEAMRAERARAEELSARESAGPPLTADETWELANALLRLDGADAAMVWLERAVAANSASAEAHFVLARELLARLDPAGVPLMHRAMDLDLEAVPAGTELLRSYHAAIGDRDALAATEIESESRYEHLHEAATERSTVSKKDALTRPDLSAADRQQLVKAASVRGVKALWIARKQTKRVTGKQVLVILIEPSSKFWGRFGKRRAAMTQAVYETLVRAAAPELVVIEWVDEIEWLVKKVKEAGGVCVTERTGVRSLRADPWHKVHRRAIVFAGIGAIMIGGLLWLFWAPTRMYDPQGLLTSEDREQWDHQLAAVMSESGVDMRILVDSLPAGTDLAALALNEARRLGVGRTSDRRGLFLLVDVASGDLRLEVGPKLEGIFPDGFTGRILRAHTGGVLTEDTMNRSLTSTLMLLVHRLRESALAMEYDPASVTDIKDSTRLAAGGGATFTMAAGGPLRLDRAPDPVLDTLLGPGASAAEALERYGQWLSLPVYVPRAQFLTEASRGFYEYELKITPAFWDFLRYLYVGTAFRIEERGDLAVAFATENPLISPLYFRRTAEGWQMDVVAELRDTRNLMGGGYSWSLVRNGSDHDVAFADLMIGAGGIWRFRDGANQEMRWRGTVQ